MEHEPPAAADDPAVTLSIVRRIRPRREQEYEQLLQATLDLAADFPGFLGGRIFRPTGGELQYRTVLRFDRTSSLRAWEESEPRQNLLAATVELAEADAQIANITGTAQERPLAMALTPLEDFVRTSVSGIGLLLLGTLAAVILANTPMADGYEAFWNAELTIGTADFGITETLRHWVNDALMALFFFIVGLEIKREVLVGEMRYPRQAALAISAAVGGVAVPALIFALINRDGAGLHGWGIPMATDTAFALGILALLGSRVRPMLLVFLTAFAIVDDLLAVGVIAIFYTETISWGALAIAGVLLGGLVVANAAGFHRWPVYAILGLGVWIAVFESGVHATAAGVLVALTVPARSWINPSEFLLRGRQLIDDFEAACFVAPNILTNEPQQQATQSLARLVEDVETPMTYFQHRLNPWVAYGILPIFAFANAGIPLVSGLGAALANPVAWGVVAGLVIGKPLGITLFAWLAVRLGIASLPRAISWPQVLGVGWLGGIGFTISLFVTELAFEAGQLADVARVGILFGSVIAGVAGYLVLRQSLPPPRDEAEG
ncbi:MAG: Na+/H+ antiporter NhaA [Chloroflexota bacterium]|nr:Na+/H+ antiporter NhaA [Chloroflexota bacterium]